MDRYIHVDKRSLLAAAVSLAVVAIASYLYPASMRDADERDSDEGSDVEDVEVKMKINGVYWTGTVTRE